MNPLQLFTAHKAPLNKAYRHTVVRMSATPPEPEPLDEESLQQVRDWMEADEFPLLYHWMVKNNMHPTTPFLVPNPLDEPDKPWFQTTLLLEAIASDASRTFLALAIQGTYNLGDIAPGMRQYLKSRLMKGAYLRWQGLVIPPIEASDIYRVYQATEALPEDNLG